MKKISQDSLYIGVDDLSIDLFESQYKVPEGISYNSYIIRDSKTAVLDTVDARKGEEWKAEIEAAFGGTDSPDYLVIHHLEPDHSGLISWDHFLNNTYYLYYQDLYKHMQYKIY